MYTSYIFAVLVVGLCCGAKADDIEDKLRAADTATTAILNDIYATWEVDKYPLFLKSAWMPKRSWDHMLAKFEQRILEVFDSKRSKNFTISFTGSSVTAGHDSPFSVSYPVVVGEVMAPAFAPLGINLVSNNDAMGNNPCMPYDACVATFSGPEADIVHWEQQFNCYLDGDPRMIEQFVRQALYMPKNPLVIIAGSVTPNWHDKDCKDPKPHNLDEEEKQYLDMLKEAPQGIEQISTEKNKGDRSRFPRLHDMLKAYPSAGIQSFEHQHYEKYKCLGPYIPTWGDGVASWHPSKMGHKIRAHHYAHTWLSAYQLATRQVLAAYKKGDKVSDMLKSVTGFLNTLRPTYPLSTPVSKTQTVSDNVQCLTAFEPHQFRERTLKNHIISGLREPSMSSGWRTTELEQLLDPGIVKKARERGYLDQKFIIYGTKSDGPLNIKVTVKSPGNFYICEAPGVWGKLPDGFVSLWKSEMRLFLTPVSNPDKFVFSKESAVGNEVTTKKYVYDEICTRLEKPVSVGTYVLTIVPELADKNIMVSTLLVP